MRRVGSLLSRYPHVLLSASRLHPLEYVVNDEIEILLNDEMQKSKPPSNDSVGPSTLADDLTREWRACAHFTHTNSNSHDTHTYACTQWL